MKFLIIFLCLMTLHSGQSKYHEFPPDEFDKSTIPVRNEFRGVWLTTVVNLDWPSNRNLTTDQQQMEIIQTLDQLKLMGLNTILFQVRAEGDAFYSSEIEPWSFWLTGEQGKAPNPFYDPLAFVVTEAHRRGMEIHAWLNPYRLHRDMTSYIWHESHIALQKPHLILKFPMSGTNTFVMMNPGLQESRDFIAGIVSDIVRRYNVDGIHFDDYFYPYTPKITNEDLSAFQSDPRGLNDIGDWRRDNVRLMVQQVNDSIKSIDPLVKLGISPFGIRLNTDAGTNGTEGYHSIYADPLVWLEDGSIDYITPQIYWETDHPLAPYEPILRFWSATAALNGRHTYPGLAPYKMGGSWNWPLDELAQQLEINRKMHPYVQGEVFFRTFQLTSNMKGLADTLKTHFYKKPALVPVMDWLGGAAPDPVEDISYRKLNGDVTELRWRGQSGAMRYAVYRFDVLEVTTDPEKITNNMSLIGVTGEPHFIDMNPAKDQPAFYVITSISRNWHESAGKIIQIE